MKPHWVKLKLLLPHSIPGPEGEPTIRVGICGKMRNHSADADRYNRIPIQHHHVLAGGEHG
jgi:hypothetical protein